jgi:hypothetical protein
MGYSLFFNGTYPIFRFQTVSGTLITRSPIGLAGFLLPQAVSLDSMAYRFQPTSVKAQASDLSLPEHLRIFDTCTHIEY